MESTVVFCAVLLSTAVFTVVSVEGTNLWTNPHTQLDTMVTAQDDTFFKDYVSQLAVTAQWQQQYIT